MEKTEFEEYLENNSNIKDMFMEKALTYQQEKNKERQVAKRWRDGRVEHETEMMWQQFFDGVYEKIRSNVKKGHKWEAFLEKNEVLDNLEMSVAEMNFE
jgi:predicted helicase